MDPPSFYVERQLLVVSQHLSDPLNSTRLLTLEHVLIPLPPFLLAVLQAQAVMILQHAMLLTKVALAERAVAHYALRCLLAFLISALLLFGWHTA